MDKPIKDFAEELADAYSTNRYKGGWAASIRMLRGRGFNDRQIEAIIRSKWTRWAGDASGKAYGHVTSADLSRFLDSQKDLQREVEYLTEGTFSNA
jgi:hypothetical protein